MRSVPIEALPRLNERQLQMPGIPVYEALREQQRLVTECLVPRQMLLYPERDDSRAHLLALGFGLAPAETAEGEQDALFYRAQLPEGWRYEACEGNPNWLYLRDGRACVRAYVRYDANPWQRHAEIEFTDTMFARHPQPEAYLEGPPCPSCGTACQAKEVPGHISNKRHQVRHCPKCGEDWAL